MATPPEKSDVHELVGHLPSKKVSSRSALSLALQLVHTVLLLAILCVLLLVYSNLQQSVVHVERAANLLFDPKNEPDMAAVHATSNFVRSVTYDVAGTFFFGSANGTIPSFVRNLMTYDLRTFAKAVNSFSTVITNAFVSGTKQHVCYQPLTCPQGNTEVECANKRLVWCDYQGQIKNCARTSCIGNSVAYGASLAQGVSAKLMGWKPIGNSSYLPTDPAFSSGIFRLDQLLRWAQSQTSTDDWMQAGKMCGYFVWQVKQLDWTIQYVDTNLKVETYDANGDVRRVADYVDQVCSVLQKIN